MGPLRHPCPRSQRGAASVGIAFLTLMILAASLATALSMSGSAVRDAAMNEEQIAALFVAESGLERAQGILNAAVLNESNTNTTCTDDIRSGGPDFHVPAGNTTSFFRYTALTAWSDPFGRSGNPKCTKWCDIQVVGTARGATRTLNLTVCTPAPGGGAMGCGGGGEPGNCPYVGSIDGVVHADWNKDIVQTIKVATTPVILLSNMAYLRHPVGGVNANAAKCVALGLSGTTPIEIDCTTQWNDESNHSTGNPVVGSRGASALIPQEGRYDLKQNLDVNSIFAAVSVRFTRAPESTQMSITGSPDIPGAGSYWNDNSSPGTVSNNATTSGQTNNGAACEPSEVTATCPISTTPPPTIPKSGTSQASRSWCYGADTLVFGFSGRSSNNHNGALTSFRFGTSPESKPVPDGTVAYPVVRNFNTQLYSTLRTIYNPDYLSASNAISGAVVTGAAGATFTATLTDNETSMNVSSVVTGGKLSVGDIISGSNRLGGPGKTSIIKFLPAGGGQTYILQHQSSGNVTTALTAKSKLLYVSSTTIPAAVGDTILGAGVTANTIEVIVAGIGGAATYTLSTSQTIPPNTSITSNGMTVTTSSSIPTAGPTAGTRIAVRWTGSGTGLLAAGTTVSTVTNATTFTLSTRPTTPLSGAQICGGICAFFNHSSANATTDFTIEIPGTQQWAAGMTCLKGVDLNNIVGLVGTGGSAKPTAWHEVVR